MKNVLMSSIINQVAKTPEMSKKVELLHKCSRSGLGKELKLLLGYMFDKRLEMGLPPGTPAIKTMPLRESANPNVVQFFYDALSRLHYLRKVARGNWKESDAQNFFNRLYSSCHPEDAALLVRIKDQNPPDGLTRDVVHKAFPLLEATWPPDNQLALSLDDTSESTTKKPRVKAGGRKRGPKKKESV